MPNIQSLQCTYCTVKGMRILYGPVAVQFQYCCGTVMVLLGYGPVNVQVRYKSGGCWVNVCEQFSDSLV